MQNMAAFKARESGQIDLYNPDSHIPKFCSKQDRDAAVGRRITAFRTVRHVCGRSVFGLVGYMALLVLVLPICDAAAEGSVIWKPVKHSPTSYSTRLGVTSSNSPAASVGMEVGLQSDAAGGPITLPVSFWGKIVSASSVASKTNSQRELNLNYEPAARTAILHITERIKEIISGDYDFEMRSDFRLAYDYSSVGDITPEMDHAFKLARPVEGTAVGLRISSERGLRRMVPTLTIERRFGSHIRLSGSVAGLTNGKPKAAVHSRYSIRW